MNSTFIHHSADSFLSLYKQYRFC